MMSKFVLALFITAASSAMASNVPVASVSASSTFSSYNVNNLINGAGLSGGLHDNNYANMWMSDYGDVTATLTFNLGATYTLDSASVWNYNAKCCGLDRGVDNFNILVSTDGVNFTLAESVTGLPEGTGSPIAADVIGLPNVTASYVEFQVLSNYGDYYTGLSAVQFDGTLGTDTTVTPEPSYGLLMLALMAGGCFVVRRRLAA